MKKIALFLLLTVAFSSMADEPSAAKTTDMTFTVDNLWVMIAGMLVFIMHIGFGTLESGLARAKNCTNVLFKNALTPPLGIITFFFCGYSLMYSGNWQLGHLLAFNGFGAHPPVGGGNPHFTFWTDFFFQGMFAATCATIVSGAVAGRIKVNAYIIFTILYAGVVYPVIGSWGWGGGWLAGINFHDFAGSTFVHAIGGWGALAGVILLGPRIGKYAHGRSNPIAGHNMPLAFLGVFLLWFGWFGFNGGSVLSADPETVSYVLVSTTLAACAGVIASMVTSMFTNRGKADFTMMLNGCLAGLVGITAGADCVSMDAALVIGAICGVIVVFAVLMFDRLRLDDPVGALSVHLVCGILGTLAVGVFALPEYNYTFMSQLAGVGASAAVAFPAALAIFATLKYTVGIRVTAEEELRGLDVSEHGMEAYSGFQIFANM
ncbi:MAG: ammonium transporter [Victivallaceae bacterium]|nr:ammonium transporter [Victivallaceae bacterium]